jgi:hypothetical protein
MGLDAAENSKRGLRLVVVLGDMLEAEDEVSLGPASTEERT